MNGIREYRSFLKAYLLPIIGISYNNNAKAIDEPSTMGSDVIRQVGNRVIFSAFGRDVAYVEIPYRLPDESLALGRSIIGSFFHVSRYKISSSSQIKMNYSSDDIYQANVELAIQRGIANWCVGCDNEKFHQLLRCLEQWAVKTYEGKKVTFGFIYNPKVISDFSEDYGTWLDFLSDDYSATLSDCIHSVIELDKNCNFSKYCSITDGGVVSAYELSHHLPYRFAGVIQQYVKGDSVGVFLLSNGDIVLAKNESVQFIKRNLKWVNLSFEVFSNIVNAKYKKGKVPKELMEQVYASTLDVSFSHTGGIISVIKDLKYLTSIPDEKALTEKRLEALPILNPCDNLLNRKTLDELRKIMEDLQKNAGLKPIKKEEKQKRLLKRKVVDALVNRKGFLEIDRKLRAELIAMDGACILDLSGNVCAVGAIIQNDSGSSGGGRSAAAKKLSNFGIAIKISSDGYIELFIEGEPVYAVK